VKSRGPTLTQVISAQRGQGRVKAVTSLDDDVFVLRSKNQQVEVYDAVSCKLQRHISVSGLGDHSNGLAACAHYKCLYVSDSDWGHENLHRVELIGSNEVMKWSVDGDPTGLSVNKEHNVVVTCAGADKLQEYTTHGSLVREICLQAGATDPWHAVQLSSGEYVVSLYTSQVVVSVVGLDGHVRRSYGRSHTHVGRMKHSRCLAVTKNDDILVADHGNDRILSINSSLSSIQELVLPIDGGIQRPRGLCLDESLGRLYVGEFGGRCRVLVLDNVKL